MGNFIKYVFASCLGVILASLVVFGIVSIVVSRIVASADSTAPVKPNTVLTLNFNQVIPELSNNIPADPFDLDMEGTLGLHEILGAIERAKEDDDIKGIFLDLNPVGMQGATASLVRRQLIDFKESGKFVAAYSNYYNQGSYYLASAADKVFVHPLGEVDFRGYAVMIPFFKDMLDRLDVKMQIYYAGQFKSATEPFRRYNMSEQNREQVGEYINALYDIFLNDISESRDIPVSELRRIADNYLIRKSEDAVQYKLVDQVAYRDEVLDHLRQQIGLEEDDKIKSVGIQKYNKANPRKIELGTTNRIAVVYAEGSIVDGNGEVGSIGGDEYARLIRKLRKDDKIKAIVLRVNSGGGSGLASDIMWRELILAKQAGKPVIATMGDVAASGGYYIACAADSIYAEPNTITGSIGVFGMIPSLEGTMREHVGINFDTVKTGPYAIGITPFMDIPEDMGNIIQNSVEDFYETFLARVAEGRNMSRDQVHAVAQGRVWTGQKAQQLGLVDEMGGLQQAIATAARMAELDSYRLTEYPKRKTPFEELIQEFSGQDKDEPKVKLKEAIVREGMGELYTEYAYLKKLLQVKGPQARMPFVLELK